MHKITLLSLPNGQQVMGEIIDEDDDTISLDGPITIVLSNPLSSETAIYTARYMPLSKDWIVTFQKMNIVAFSFADDSLVDHYHSMVKHYKGRPFNYSSPTTENQETADDVNEIERNILKNQGEEAAIDEAPSTYFKNKTYH